MCSTLLGKTIKTTKNKKNEFFLLNVSFKRTKVTCKEGGCGACIVHAEIYDYETKKPKFVSINSVRFRSFLVSNLYWTNINDIYSVVSISTIFM